MNSEQSEILKHFFRQVAELAGDTLTAFVEVGKEDQVSNATQTHRVELSGNRFLNRKEIADRLGVSVRHIGNLINEGLPTVPVGERRVLFNYEEVLTWIKDGRPKERGKIKLRVVS